MIELTLLLLAAAFAFALVRWTGLPALPILILSGIGLQSLHPLEVGFVGEVITLGVMVLVFLAGIELNPQRLRGRGQTALRVGALQFATLGGVGFGVAIFLGYSLQPALYVALALTASSTLVVVKILQERRLLFEPVGKLVTGVLLLQDLLVILAIAAVTRLPEGPLAVATGVGGTLALIALTAGILRLLHPTRLDRWNLGDEALMLLSLSLLFVYLGVAALLDLPLVIGAFLAGVAQSGFPVSGLVRGQLNSLGDFFHSILFVSLGAFITLPSGGELLQSLALLVLVVGITPPLVAALAERAGFSARPALTAGLLLAQTSEFSLVVALQGVLIGQLESSVFTILTLVTVLTMMLTPFLAEDRVAWSLLRFHPFRRLPPSGSPPEGHILLLGCGQHGQELLETLMVTRHDLVVVDDDPALVAQLRANGVTAVRGDVSDPALLSEVGAHRARIILSTLRRFEDNAPVLEFAPGVPIWVRGFNEEDGAWIRERGGRPILYSEAALHDFQLWYESEEGQRVLRNPMEPLPYSP